jgi:ribosomal protein L37AE/L43A
LSVTPAVAEYAKLHGALLEDGFWFCYGDVPLELEEFVFTAQRLSQLSAPQQEIGPSCPKCGSQTVKRFAKATGDAFWGCPRWPDCKGSLNWNYTASKRSAKLLAIDNKRTALPSEDHQKSQSEWSDVREEAKRLTVMVVELHGSVPAAKRWLETPKVGLNGKTTLDVMGTLEGCAEAKRLLEDKFK